MTSTWAELMSILRWMEQEGLVELFYDEAGRECVRITPEGRAALARAWPLWRAAQKVIQQHLGHVTTQRLHTLLAAAIEKIPAGPDGPTGTRGGVKP